ncbi:MAG: ABC transporter ATP-binding protein [Lachnospiraceae bacterium]|nr:ABC transporter ATP-binding protein [Lachnospiraceae bacterium]
MIKLDHVEKQYSGFHLDCTMEVPEGSVTALIGPNGAGKSTTFKALLGLIFPEKGRIELLGKPVEGLSREEKEDIGVVLSDSCFTGYLSIEDILPVLGRLYRKFDRQKFLNKCQDFGLAREKKIKELSTGMKAKLKILMALSHEARLLILDEPTAGLDVLAREEILDLLREYMIPGDRSILISSHISSDLEGLCDDLYLINQGQILLHEETDVLLGDYGLLKVTEEQYQTMDRSRLLRRKRESFGYRLLTNQKRFYLENAPELTMEKGSIDEVMTMMIRGEAI